MHKKSSAKLGEVKGHRGEERTGEGAKYGASVVRRWLERPAYVPTACAGLRRHAGGGEQTVAALLGQMTR